MNLKVSKTSLVLFCALFVVFSQIVMRLDPIPILDFLFSGLRFFVFIVVFIYYIRHLYFTKFELLLLLYALCIFSVTIIFSTDQTIRCLSHIFNVSVLVVIFKFFDTRQVVKIVSVILSILVYLNFGLTLLYPNGHFFVNGSGVFILGGNYNQMGATLLVALITNAVYVYGTKSFLFRINFAILTLVSIFTVIFVGSMTSSVGIVLFSLFVIFASWKISRLALKIFFGFVVAFNVILLYLQMEIDNNIITWFVEDVLEKDLTFTDRVRVWSESIDLFLESKLLGHGIKPMEWYSYHLGVLTPHNMILSTLIKGGIVLLFILVFIIAYVIKDSSKYISSSLNVLQFGFSCFFLMMTMETYAIELIFYLIILMFFIKDFYDPQVCLNNNAL